METDRANADKWNTEWTKYDECKRVLKWDTFPGGAFVMTGGMISAMEFAYFTIAMRHAAPKLPKVVFNVDTVHSMESCVAAAEHEFENAKKLFNNWKAAAGKTLSGKDAVASFFDTHPVQAHTPGLSKMLRKYIEGQP